MVDIPDRLLWCSWCWDKAYFNTVEKRWLGRDLLRCTKCWRYAAGCFKCNDAASRSSMNGENMDKLCGFCQGAVKKWGRPPEEEVVMGHGWCSYCLTRNSFRLITKNYIDFQIYFRFYIHQHRRNDYECEGCHRPACFCVNCGEAYTRGTAALCVLCEGSIQKWQAYEENMKLLLHGPSWCSWCIEFTAHRRQESNAIRRHVYECTHCRQRTLPCTHCEDAMAEGGPAWDDDLCEKCRGRIYPDWESNRREKERVLSHVLSQEELQRDSYERQRAVREGLLRPFLLLVSMRSNLRVLAAAALGWNLILSPGFGDAHAEAGSLLFEPRMGIQQRAMGVLEKISSRSSEVRWEAILRRVQQHVWHTCPTKSGEAEAEEALLLEVARTTYQRLTTKEKEELEEEMKHDKSGKLLKEVSENSALTRSELRAYAMQICSAIVISPEGAVAAATTLMPALMPGALAVTAVLSVFAGPLFLLGLGSLVYQGAKLYWGSSEERLLLPLILILNQRIITAAQHINIAAIVAATPIPMPPASSSSSSTASSNFYVPTSSSASTLSPSLSSPAVSSPSSSSALLSEAQPPPPDASVTPSKAT